MRIKITLLFLLFTTLAFSQNDLLLKRKYTYTYNKYNVYGFIDVVRFVGVGAEYRPVSFFSLDFKVGAVYPNGIIAGGVSANDYFSMKGVGFMLSPKIYPAYKKRLYIGFNAAFYAYGYSNKWEDKGIDPSTFSTNNLELRDRRTTSFAFGPSVGYAINVENVNFEFFMGIGAEMSNNKVTVYQSMVPGAYPSFPYSYRQDMVLVNFLAGVKIGFGFGQKKLYAKKYYLKTLNALIYDDNKYVLRNYRAKVISREKLHEYYQIKKEQYCNISAVYMNAPEDTATLSDKVKQGRENIKKYINSAFKSRP